jgi:hypothetical protein
MMDLAGEAIGRQPLRYRIGFEEGPIDAFGRRAQDAMKIDGSGSHDVFAFHLEKLDILLRRFDDPDIDID